MAAGFAARIHNARERLLQRRAELRRAHEAGSSSVQIVTSLAALVDSLVSSLARSAIESLGTAAAAEFQARVAIVAVGGYGRLELAPFSDIDLLFLYHPKAQRLGQSLCEQLVRDLWDIGLAPGSSLRTIQDCVALAREDISVHTALLEARLLGGSRDLVGALGVQIGRLTRGRRSIAFIDAVAAERAREQEKYGSAVHLLEPDVKKSKGGLRELHLMRWVGRARYGVASLDELGRDGLSAHDVATVRHAYDFLLRVRNDLHFNSGRAQDGFVLHEQVRMALDFGYRDEPGSLAVERFMQQYYRHGDALVEVTERFVSAARRSSVGTRLGRWLRSQRLSPECELNDGEIVVQPEHLPAVQGDLEAMVRLFALSAQHRATIEPRTREHIRQGASTLHEVDPVRACGIFLDMLGEAGGLGAALHAMHSVGVLELLIPEFGHARGLIQFNQYHKYAVDEHTLLCVAHAEELQEDLGPYGDAYRSIHHKEILHLALLLHDLGKGHEGDHSELGRVLAEKTAVRFGLTTHQRDVLVFLVHQHLVMSNLAYRRDTADERVVLEFARKVGTPEVLQMLLIMTAVDIQSVGPGVWTSWKADVLLDLYRRTMEVLTGEAQRAGAEEKAEEVRAELYARLADTIPTGELRMRLAALQTADLLAAPPPELAENLMVMHALLPSEVQTSATYEPATGTCRYTVYAFDQITEGIFHKICGVMAAKGLNILSARITTHADGAVVDRFEVLDGGFRGAPPQERHDEIGAAVRAVLQGQRTVESMLQRRFLPADRKLAHQASTKVEIDNETSERFTIIEVFAQDQPGLLYAITRRLFELSVSVFLAKIATSLDQVLDVFYVTNRSGAKILEDRELEHIRRSLSSAIDAFEPAPATKTNGKSGSQH